MRNYTAEDLIKIAENEVGYHEKRTNSQLDDKTANAGTNDWTKYSRDLYNAGYYNGNKNGYWWCDVFYDWLHYIASGKVKTDAEYVECQTGLEGAGCGYSMQFYQNAGRFDKTPKEGDQIFFRWSGNSGVDHTGLVYKIVDNKVYTIEGNSSDAVSKRSYNKSDSCILGYGHPRYKASDVKPTPKPLKSIDVIAQEVLDDKWGTGTNRKIALEAAGYNYEAVQNKVNELLKNKPAKKTNAEIATEVLNGLWGNNPERKEKLIKAGYNYEEIQTLVNELVKAKNPDFKVKVNINNLNIRTGPGTNYKSVGFIAPGIYTIVDSTTGTGSNTGWYKLKSGAGWIAADYAVKI